MGRGGGGGSRGGGGRSGGSRGGSFRSSSRGGRGVRSSGSGGFHFSGGGFRPVRHVHHYHGSYGRAYTRVASAAESTVITIFVIIVMAVVLIMAVLPQMGSSMTRSTIHREKLDSQYVTLSDTWYDDSAMGWIASGKVLEDGLKDFYNETGVQPYLVITDQVDGNYNPTGDDVWNYANQVYDQMFTDEGHMVFVFQCPDGGTDYIMAACTGVQAKTVLDDAEALEILYDYVDSYFWSDRDEDEMFADAFRDAGKRIMDTQMSTGSLAVIVFGVVVVAVVVFLIVRTAAKRSKEKAEETERILNTPVSELGNQAVEDLKDKYDAKEVD